MASATVTSEYTGIELYLERIATGLGSMDSVQKKEIVAEIRSHLEDRLSELKAGGDPNAVFRVLRALGDPNELTAQFVTEGRLRSGAKSYVPWTLLRRAARIACTGIRGFAVFLVGLVGYVATLAAIVAVAVKPFMPGMGLWVGRSGMVWGIPAPGVQGHELLGGYFMEATTGLAFVFACGTTLLLRRMLNKVPFFRK